MQDHAKRPSAHEALKHPWLRGPGASERSHGRKLAMGVVQRIQVGAWGGRLVGLTAAARRHVCKPDLCLP
jgi:hypothetical protein